MKRLGQPSDDNCLCPDLVFVIYLVCVWYEKKKKKMKYEKSCGLPVSFFIIVISHNIVWSIYEESKKLETKIPADQYMLNASQ